MVLLFLMSGGTEFQIAIDLTIKDLLARPESTSGTLRFPCAALLVADGSSWETMCTGHCEAITLHTCRAVWKKISSFILKCSCRCVLAKGSFQ